MSRPSLLAPAFFAFLASLVVSASGITGCILNFDGLTGGEGSSGGASCPDCDLCQGSCSEGQCDAILDAPAGATAFRVAVSGGALFASDPMSNAILRYTNTTTKGEQSEVFEVPNAPQAIAADDNYLFWGTEGDGMFRCVKADCSTLVELLPGDADSAPRQLIAEGGWIYWVTGPDLSAGKVLRCSVNACVPEVIAMDLFRPHGIALDDQFVYFTVHGMDGMFDGSIMRSRKDGSDLAPYLGGLDGPSGVAVSGGYLYFTAGVYGGRVLRCLLGPDACGAPEEITPPSSLPDMPVRMPMSVAVTGEWVIWTNDGDFTVMACPTTGCSTTSDGLPVILASGLMSPGGLVATSGCAFWTAAPGVFGASRP